MFTGFQDTLRKIANTAAEIYGSLSRSGLRGQAAAAALLQTFSVVGSLVTPILMGISFEKLTAGSQNDNGTITDIKISDEAIFYLLACGGVILSSVALSSSGRLITGAIKHKFGAEVNSRVLTKFSELDLDTTLTVPLGVFVQHVRQVIETQEVVPLWLDELYPVLAEFLVSDVVLFYLDWRLGMALLGMHLMSFSMAVLGTKSTDAVYETQKQQTLKVFFRIINRIQNHEGIRLFGHVKKERDGGILELNDLCVGATRLTRLPEYNVLAQNILGTFGTAGIIALSAYELAQGRLRFDYFVMLFIYTMQLNKLFGRFSRALSQLLIFHYVMGETKTFLSKPPAIPRITNPLDLTISDQTSSVDFRDVVFSYPGEAPVLNNVSFSIRAGSKTAIIGLSGAGKSTIARLLLHFNQPQSGSILISGADIATIRPETLCAVIGSVPQQPRFSGETLADVIRYAKPEITDDSIMDILRVVDMGDFATPENLLKKVGQGGLKLSGGQMQRIAIAQVLLRDPFIYVLDEAMSALDAETTLNIQRMLDSRTFGRTTIVITHQLLSIMNADNIIVLDQGGVIQQGNFSELVSDTSGRFYQLLSKYCLINGLEIHSLRPEPRVQPQPRVLTRFFAEGRGRDDFADVLAASDGSVDVGISNVAPTSTTPLLQRA